MTSKIEDIRKIQEFSEEDKLFLDTNVWIYIHYGIYPYNDKYFRKWYTDAFERMRKGKSQIFLDAFVLSEFINLFAHLEYDRIVPREARLPRRNNYKIFRESKEGRKTVREIIINANKMLETSQLCDLDYNFIKSMLQDQFIEYTKFNSDFNDLTYIKLCKKHGFTLVTHDGDFKDCGIHVLTANNALLPH